MADGNLWNSLTTKQQEDFGTVLLGRTLRRIPELQARFDAWDIKPSSRLVEDNAASPAFRPMTYELHYLMTSALDHVTSVDTLIRVGKIITPFAPFSLIRSAIESAAIGLWLQNGGKLDKRIFRLIQLQWSLREMVDVHSRSAGIDPRPNTALLEAALDATKARRGGLKQYDYKRRIPRTTDILTETDGLFRPKLEPTGLNTWRSCSGVTHGNVHFTAGMVNTQKMPTPAQGGATEMNTPSTAALALMLGGALTYLELLMSTLEDQGKARPGRPNL